MTDFTDRIRDRVADSVADHTDKVSGGMDPRVCEGCPYRGDGALKRCGLCGCPTLPNFPLHQMGVVPTDCPRIPEHQGRR